MGGKDEEFLILYFSQDYGHQHVPLTTEKKNRLQFNYAFQMSIFKNKRLIQQPVSLSN